MREIITVTRPLMPPLDEFTEYLEKIWTSKQLTNNGPFHQEFEKALCSYLGIKFISLFANGTLALVTALQALKIAGEVITSPYSFVATTHSLWWNNIKPVFCDIDPLTYNINPDRLEEAITPLTTAILPVHVYGNPCDVEKIQKIADTYGLKVIYDACHTFGEKINNNSILNYGDFSVLSFHATKVFTTFEGGAIVSPDLKSKQRIDYLKNFGFADELTVVAPGINAKMNEIQAAFGLLQLKYVDKAIDQRNKIACLYRELLADTKGITLLYHKKGVRYNYSYFPILINSEEYGLERDAVYDRLKDHEIYSRRYFYPLISKFPIYKGLASAASQNLPVAERVSNQVLCLPIYPDLNLEKVKAIAFLIKEKFGHV